MSTPLHSAAPANQAISAGKVLGKWVYTTALERLGFVQDISIDQVSGRVSSVMLRTSGRLHLYHHSYPVSWESLGYSTELDGYIIDPQRHELKHVFAGCSSVKLDDDQCNA